MNARRPSGFTLVEVMVGVVIALVSIVMMFQLQEIWDKQRRSISSGGDAQVAGSISAFQVERDLRNAGSGFGNSAFLGCAVSAHDDIGGRDFTFTYAPVLITDGAGGAPDTLSILAGNSSSPTATFEVAATSATETSMRDTRMGISLGDLVVIAHPSACWLAEVTDLGPVVSTSDSGREIGHTSGARFNTAAGAVAYNSAPPQFGELRSLGDDPRLNVWTVDRVRAVLMRNDLIHASVATDVGEGIINLQAQYGLDTNGDDVVDTWQATAPTWAQLRVVRFALLARGQDYDKVAVTTTPPTWAGGAFVMTNVDGTADSGAASLGVNNWRNYRYSVFEVTVPLRNMIWTRFW